MYTLTLHAETLTDLREKLSGHLATWPAYTEEAEQAQVAEDSSPAPRLEEVKKVLVSLIEDGKRDDALTVLKKYGARKVQEVAESDLAAFFADIQAL